MLPIGNLKAIKLLGKPEEQQNHSQPEHPPVCGAGHRGGGAHHHLCGAGGEGVQDSTVEADRSWAGRVWAGPHHNQDHQLYSACLLSEEGGGQEDQGGGQWSYQEQFRQ